jgi:adenosylcobinamide-phosphate synthase
LSWHLVSRDTSTLDESRIAAATIESLAENTSDSAIAPLFWYAVAGLPGALVYRFLNTADAMLGYRDAEREWLGKAAARLDDVANLIPARLTALCMILSAPWLGGRMEGGWRIWRRDAGTTASPNAGHPMSAAAGVLGVELEKVDHYRLGAGQPKPSARDIRRSQRLVIVSVAIALGIFITGGWIRAVGARVGAAANVSSMASFLSAPTRASTTNHESPVTNHQSSKKGFGHE